LKQEKNKNSARQDLVLSGVDKSLQLLEQSLDVVDLAIDSGVTIHTALSRMLKICTATAAGSKPEENEYKTLKASCLQSVAIYEAALAKSPISKPADSAVKIRDMHINVRFTLPDFASLARPIYSSHLSSETPSQVELTEFIGSRERRRLNNNATVQGIRIFARYPDDLSLNPHKAINSLSPITGTRVGIIGNAVSGITATCGQGAPLSIGELAINAVDIPASDGSAEGLVEAINTSSGKHYTHAILSEDNKLSLYRPDGESIRLAIRSQTAALVSGFSMGVKLCPPRTMGIPMWIYSVGAMNKSAPEAVAVHFDSTGTGLALTGKSVCEVSLQRCDWLNFDSLDSNNARLVAALLDNLKQLLRQQGIRLQKQIRSALSQLESYTASDLNTDALFLRLRELEVRMSSSLFV